MKGANWTVLGDSFDATVPPSLKGPLSAWFGWPTPSILVATPPVRINAPRKLVWETMLDFEAYEEFNPFHRRVRVVRDEATGDRYMEMKVNSKVANEKDDRLVAPETCMVAREKIFYVDEERYILVYGLDAAMASSVRVQYLLEDGDATVYVNYDVLGGVFLKLFAFAFGWVDVGFKASAAALKKRVESKM